MIPCWEGGRAPLYLCEYCEKLIYSEKDEACCQEYAEEIGQPWELEIEEK